MLRIRDEQLAVVVESRWREFERRVFAEITRCLPHRVHELGQDPSWDQVRRGVAEARARKFELEYDITRYVYLTFALGPGFATSANYPWAGEVLGNPLFSPHTQADLLWQYGLNALEIPVPAETGGEEEAPETPTEQEPSDEKAGAFDGILVTEDDAVEPEFDEAHETVASAWNEMEIEDEPGADNSADDLR